MVRSIVLITVFFFCLAVGGVAFAWAPSYVSENWDGYTSGSTPYGPNNSVNWELKNGDWMSLTGGRALSGTQSYHIHDMAMSQIAYPVDFAGVFSGNTPLGHIVVQGWFYDHGGYGTSYLGLRHHDIINNGLVRIGSNGGPNYVVQYGELVAGSGIVTVDTGFAVGEGWHYARLDIVDTGYLGFWQCQWRLHNADHSVQRTGEFAWFFDRGSATRVTVGAESVTMSAMDWDDIKVGSLEYVGPVVPEPCSALAFGFGCIALARILRRKNC